MNASSAKRAHGDLMQGSKPREVTLLSIAGIIGAGSFIGRHAMCG
ncbi:MULTISPECIES: hypothetical protein [unclassified Pseudomonas]|nr:hypothetical protein [Pseudomonas sp. PDM18]